MEKNDLAMIKAENDRLVSDIEKLKQRLREEITRTQAGVRLDLNLEKGRMREESSRQELKIKEVDTRIEQEIAGLRTAMQASKVNTKHRMNLRAALRSHLTCRPGHNFTIPCRIWSVNSCPSRDLHLTIILQSLGALPYLWHI
jgi:hypothetical protein